MPRSAIASASSTRPSERSWYALNEAMNDVGS